MTIERLLQRIGPTHEEVVINKTIFNCGRLKDRDLLCLSLFVSRKHCVFTNVKEGLFVTDLGNSNGIFINGELITSRRQVLLKDNDIIGIGCSELNPRQLDINMFVYRVKSRVVLSNDCDSTSANKEEKAKEINDERNNEARAIRKEQSRNCRFDRSNVPIKVQKTLDNNQQPQVEICDIIDDDDDIIECPSSSTSGTHQTKNKPVASTSSQSKNDTVNVAHSSSKISSNNNEIIEVDIAPSIQTSKNSSSQNKNVTANGAHSSSKISNNDNEIVKLDIVPSVPTIKREPIFKITVSTDSGISVNIKPEPQKNVKIEAQNNVEENHWLVEVKQEPESCFSQIDLEIEDGEEDTFLSSQLFDKSIKEEQEDCPEAESLIFLDDEEENIITILDSDNENENVSEVVNKDIYSNLRIKQEYPELNELENELPMRVSYVSTDNAENASLKTTHEVASRSENKAALASEHPAEPLTEEPAVDPLAVKNVNKVLTDPLVPEIVKKILADWVEAEHIEESLSDSLVAEHVNEKTEEPIKSKDKKKSKESSSKKSNNKKQISDASDVASTVEDNISSSVTCPVTPTIVDHRDSPSSHLENDDRIPSPLLALELVVNPLATSVLKSLNSATPNKKKVSFKENIAAIREYPIEAGNQLRNIKYRLNLRASRTEGIHRPLEMKLEDFLARIFAWEPAWLEQQQKVKDLPPIVKKEDMQQLPNSFNSYEQYYRRMEVLLLLETWQLLFKEYECTGTRYKQTKPLHCSFVRHSVRQMQTPNGLRYSMLAINTLVTNQDLRLQNHPVFGDMIILEYFAKYEGGQRFKRAFAYVIEVQQQNCLRYLRANSDSQLIKYCPNPDALMTYIVETRIIDEHTVQFDKVARLRSILYLRSHLRLIQGLQFVPHSGLRDSILNVDIDDFQLESVTNEQIYKYDLVTQEKLNEKQMEAVIKFTNSSIKLESKIGLLVGPPGTGKSKVIANLVTQILYGEGRYTNMKHLRILVCAPSNAAIDEIVLRLLEIRATIKDYRFKMVRIGRMESMHKEVKKISVTELAKQEAQKTYFEHQQKHSENMDQKKHKLKKEIDALELLSANYPHNMVYRSELADLKTKFFKLANKSPEEENAELSKFQNSAKTKIIHEAHVIACTLSSCYTSQMESIFGVGKNTDKIATCIVDEATQCCEAETLIPLMLGVKNLILVGDPNQLPATVMSTDAKKLGLDRSLFTRAKSALESQCDVYNVDQKDPVIMLNVQYRMVNAISHWPNKYFYGGKLIDRVNYKQAFPFQPYRVLNLDGVQDDIKFSNTSEALFVGNLINCLMTCSKISSWDSKITIGVITPYQNQKSVIMNTIREQTKNVPDNIRSKFVTEVNTIDSFQGQERDVIIMSCVRSCGIGFLSDQQRLCVALTRAKFSLIICGNFTTFQRDSMWKDLLSDARSRGVVARLNTKARPIDIKPHVIRF